eukprot:760793-Hanusia_phi.AAC.3
MIISCPIVKYGLTVGCGGSQNGGGNEEEEVADGGWEEQEEEERKSPGLGGSSRTPYSSLPPFSPTTPQSR